jgi:hypothetical protein
MFSFVFLLSFFPSFRWIPSISAEFQPIGGVIALIIISWWVVLSRFKVNRSIFFLLMYFFILVVAYALGIPKGERGSLIDLFSYMIGPSLLVYMYNEGHKIKAFQVYIVISIFLAFLAVQCFTPSAMRGELSSIMQIILPRFSFLESGGIRGISFAYAEPAHAARYIWLLIFIVFYCNSLGYINLREKVVTLAIILILSIMNKSATLLFMSFITFGLWLFFRLAFEKNIYKVLILLLAIFLLVPVVSVLINYFGFSYFPRLEQLVLSFSDIYALGAFSMDDLQFFGSIRFISVYAGYAVPSISWFGFGVGNSGNYLLEVIDLVGFNTADIGFIQNQMTSEYLKAGAYVAQLVADIGVLGVAIGLFFCIYTLFCLIATRSPLIISFGIVSLLQLLFYSTTTITAPWVVLGLALCHRKIDS